MVTLTNISTIGFSFLNGDENSFGETPVKKTLD